MAVRVRLFASLREAAGEAETAVEPGPLSAVLAQLRSRYGEDFSRRLAASSVLVDGSAVSPDKERDIPDGAEVALLPPVSGGSVCG